MRIDLNSYIYRMYFTRYETLKDIVEDGYSTVEGDNVDIYIDAASVFRSIMNNVNIHIENPLDITSIIINMCIHYISYFRRYVGVSTRCFIISSYNGIYNEPLKYVNDYNSKYVQRVNTNITGEKYIKKNIEIIESIVPYLPNIYFVDSTDIESAAMILYLINRYNNPSFIVSRDLLNAQAVACTNKTMMLYPSKFKGEDRSLSIPADKESMMISFLIMHRNRKSYDSLKGYAAKLNMISPDFFPLIMAMSGYEKRDISCIVNHVKTLKSIIDGILNGNLPNFFTYDTNQILNFLRASEYVHSEDHFKIISNYMALDMVTQSIAVNESIAAQKNILIDLHDTGEIQKINDIYFKNNPIDINRL